MCTKLTVEVMRCLFLLIACLHYGSAVYFTMADIKINIPGRSKLLPSNYPLITMYAQEDIATGDNYFRYSIEDIHHYLSIYPPKGDVTFTKKFLDGKGIGTISSHVSVEGKDGKRDKTTLEVSVSPLDPFDCDLILENLCYWTKVNYQIMEEEKPTIIGSLGSPYVWEMCPSYKLNYSLKNNNANFNLIAPSEQEKLWTLQTTGPLNRDIVGYSTNFSVTCVVENEQGSSTEVPSTIYVDILDVNNNPPVPQDNEKHVNLSSSLFKKGDEIGDSLSLIFFDLDSPSVNNLVPSVLGSKQAELIRPECKIYPDLRNNKNSTICYCRLILLQDKHFVEDNYSLILLLNDTTNRNANATGRMHVHIHFKESPGNLRIKEPLILYPYRDVKVFRSAGLLARITQPRDSTGCTNFKLLTEPGVKNIFNITDKEGIIFVHDVYKLRKAPEYVNLNVTWIKNNTKFYELIRVRVVEESTPTCMHTSNKSYSYTFCAEIDNPDECLRANFCAIATGGSESVRNRNNLERCMWRGDRNPGNKITHIYATCTPDSSTCPDGICDPLEELHSLICPQDCTNNVVFPTKQRENGRGIDKAVGICTCSTNGGCMCNPPKKRNEKTTRRPPPTTPFHFNPPNIQTVPGNAKHSIQVPDLAKCGTTCVLGIVAATLFLGGAVAMVVICWRLDRVHKAVRGKYSDESQDITAPLSDYVDRNNQAEPMSLSFHMTTSFSDSITKNIINKYAPDPKWEFPRSQLVIEQTLGEGEFGRVLRAKASNIAGQKGDTIVAVKTLKDDARESELNDLLSEYQLLKEVSHLNVIRLLGVCTTPGGPVYLIIEFAEFGSLRNYLRRSRHLKSENQRLPSSMTGIEEVEVHYDEPNVSKVTPKEILSFAWQICNGMAYLSDIKLVHRDLAARNVLLTKDKVCKISDFGLTRDVYEENAYFKRSKGRVPVKWMAPESLSDHVYTSKSDVWSFGILVWELVTLGATPYPGIAVQNLFHLIRQGYRMERPDNCSPALYKLMRKCWLADPEARPSFHELSKTWEKMLEDGNDYLDLTNNAIHNRSYFCSPFEIKDDENDLSPLDKTETNPDNYLTKSISYEKCGASDKLINEEKKVENEEKTNDNVESNELQNNNTVGYETPVKVPNKLQTPDNECPTGYTDMQAAKIIK